MPGLEKSGLKQKAVLWAFSSYDDNGLPTVTSTGVEIKVRWEKGRHEATDSNSKPIAADGRLKVDREIAIGSELWMGELEDVPETLTNVHTVIDYQEVPDVKGRRFTRFITTKKKAS